MIPLFAFPFLVVIMITPPPALDPYKAEAAAPLSTVMLSILLGSRSLTPLPAS
ncbi:hypothetical protein D3C80_1251030 [compost metagenome]